MSRCAKERLDTTIPRPGGPGEAAGTARPGQVRRCAWSFSRRGQRAVGSGQQTVASPPDGLGPLDPRLSFLVGFLGFSCPDHKQKLPIGSVFVMHR